MKQTRFFSGSGKSAELADSEILYERLIKEGDQLFIQINDNLQEFPRDLDHHKNLPSVSEVTSSDQWFTKCTD